MKIKSTGYHITKVETTDDKLSGRGGLSFILRYIEQIQIFKIIENKIGELCNNKKGKSAGFILRQVMAKLIDGADLSLTGFDRLKKDEGYASVLEVKPVDMLSSYMVKRFFKKFTGFKHLLLSQILTELFVWRLKIKGPSIIDLDLDTMVLNNDDAEKREGVDPTYKNKKGFQPLQISWKNKIIAVIFRRGSAHSNNGDDLKKLVSKVVNTIRRRYRQDVPIVLSSDSGFLDETNFEYFEKELKIFYVCSGKLYESVTEYIKGVDIKSFRTYKGKRNSWHYFEFGSKLKSWKQFRRTLFTRLSCDDNQMLLEFARPDSVLYSNLGKDNQMTKLLVDAGHKEYLKAAKIIEFAHGRGTCELNHRSLKEFMGKEQLPFKRFAANRAYYFVQLITHFLYESYKEDVTFDVVPLSSYPTMFRRKCIDFAAKVIGTGNYIILKISQSLWDGINIPQLWERCNNPHSFVLQT